MIQVLRGLGDLRLGLHGFLQRADRGVRGDLEGEEVEIVVCRRGDV